MDGQSPQGWVPAKGDPGGSGKQARRQEFSWFHHLRPDRCSQAGPNLVNPCGGRAPPIGASSQLSPRVASSVTSRAKPPEMKERHLPCGPGIVESRAGSRLLNRMLSPKFSLSLPREGQSPRSCDKCQCAISIGGGRGNVLSAHQYDEV